MIALDAKEQKYSVEKHAARLERIIADCEALIEIMRKEIPSAAFIASLLDRIGCPKTVAAWGLSQDVLPVTFKATKDIRDKYVLSRLAFDLGVLDEMADACIEKEQET
jgi:glycerol-1-phosphate dehydrogenase [NAD(P)+]